MTSHLSNKISNMCLLCAVCVVILHMAGSPDPQDWTWWTHHVFGIGFFGIAVPFFFLLSGYFVEAKYESGGAYGQIVGKRIHTLLIPFLIWNFVYALLMLGSIGALDVISHRPLGTNWNVSGWQWLTIIGLYPFSEPYLGPTWYIRGLFIIVLCSPVLRWMFDKAGWWVLGVLWLFMYCTMAYYPSGTGAYDFWRWMVPTLGFFYFPLGMWFKRHPIPDELGRRIAFSVLPLGVIVQLVEVYLCYRGINAPIYFRAFMIPLVLGGVWYLVPAWSLPVWLKGMSFPVYVLHYIFISFVFFFNHDPCSPLWYVMRGVMGVVGPILVTLFIRRFMPRFAVLAFGGR